MIVENCNVNIAYLRRLKLIILNENLQRLRSYKGQRLANSEPFKKSISYYTTWTSWLLNGALPGSSSYSIAGLNYADDHKLTPPVYFHFFVPTLFDPLLVSFYLFLCTASE
ncbi:hypothetical protein GWI33_008504 [Rhynchophorus ferrugineus]|nr:hypothetical protein GWI33_008504 [Rhynchophorus ferrugineus]